MVTEIPDLLEPITGWRLWFVTNGLRLRSLTSSLPLWHPETPPARAKCGCGVRHPEAPAWEGHCGIYALKSRQLLGDFGGRYISNFSEFRLHGLVFGRVALWGRVIEHKNGYRAELAWPISVSDRRIAETYHVQLEEEELFYSGSAPWLG